MLHQVAEALLVKSLHHAAAGVIEDEDEYEQLPSDLMACILHLRTQTIRTPCTASNGGPVPPVVLRSQLYALIKDRTAIARELDALQRENAIRAFKISTGKKFLADSLLF